MYPLGAGDGIASAGTGMQSSGIPLPEGTNTAQAVLSAGKGTDNTGSALWTTSKRQQLSSVVGDGP